MHTLVTPKKCIHNTFHQLTSYVYDIRMSVTNFHTHLCEWMLIRGASNKERVHHDHAKFITQ